MKTALNENDGISEQQICHIRIFVLITSMVAIAATWGVLAVATRDSESDTASTLSTAHDGPEQRNLWSSHPLTSGSANVLLILLDDAGWADFSLHADDPWYALSTPHMDEIMRGGIYFSNYYTQTICTPARASLMTGRWTWVLGFQMKFIMGTCMKGHLSTKFSTYAELTEKKGYKNYLYGKWHLGMDSWDAAPPGRGFHKWIGNFNSGGTVGGGGAVKEKGGWYSVWPNRDWQCNTSLAARFVITRTYTECLMRSFDYYYVDWNASTAFCFSFYEHQIPHVCSNYSEGSEPYISDSVLYSEGQYIHLPLRDLPIDFWLNKEPLNPLIEKRVDMYIFDDVTEELRELSETPEKRWTMTLALKTPHEDSAFLENGTHTPIRAKCSRFFDESSTFYNYDRGAICQKMHEVDERIGMVIHLLKELGTYDDTIIILTNDNGGTSGQNPFISDGETYNYAIHHPLRGVKTSYYQGAVKTVLGISGGALPIALRGTNNTDLHHVSDIAPTIAAIAGFTDTDFEDISDGTNFDGYPLLSTNTASYGHHEYIYLSLPSFTQNWTSNDTAIVLSDGRKYIGPGLDFGAYGYWGTLPIWESAGPIMENCSAGCVWDLSIDPYEKNNIGSSVDQTNFHDLVKAAYASDLWHDGMSPNMADCSVCSCCQTCAVDNTSVEFEGFYYYFPWLS